MTLAGAKRCAYLGPAATFTEAALIGILTEHGVLDTVERVPMRSQNEMFDAVRSGEVDAAVVPIENSVEGGVPATLDALTRAGNLQIVAEAVVPVRFVLAARPGTVTLETLTAFGTHPHGEAQTRLWMQEHAPHATYHPTGSTAEAARELGTASAEADVPFQAAIGPLLAAQTYGLEVLADDIGENTGAQTRFVCVQRPGLLPEPTGWDRTTFVVGLASDRARGQHVPHRIAAHGRRAGALPVLDRRAGPRA
jgi:prephenate dehydratase